MHIILGGTGHVGSATASALIEGGEPVTIVTRDGRKAERWRDQGAEIAVADVTDAASLRNVLHRGDTLFLLNPPAAPASDTDAVERASVASIMAAVEGSGLRHIVAESTYGAQAGDHLGDLNTLFELEQRLAAQSIPHNIIRAAYYFTNWDMASDPARQEGTVPSTFPPDFKLPMVAPDDLGKVAARLMVAARPRPDPLHVEGPARYSAQDVAEAFAAAMDRVVRVVTTPRDQLAHMFASIGFSRPAARSYARMTEVVLDQCYPMPDRPEHGATTLPAYIKMLVTRPHEPVD